MHFLPLLAVPYTRRCCVFFPGWCFVRFAVVAFLTREFASKINEAMTYKGRYVEWSPDNYRGRNERSPFNKKRRKSVINIQCSNTN